jgi:hypothetical protein
LAGSGVDGGGAALDADPLAGADAGADAPPVALGEGPVLLLHAPIASITAIAKTGNLR